MALSPSRTKGPVGSTGEPASLEQELHGKLLESVKARDGLPDGEFTLADIWKLEPRWKAVLRSAGGIRGLCEKFSGLGIKDSRLFALGEGEPTTSLSRLRKSEGQSDKSDSDDASIATESGPETHSLPVLSIGFSHAVVKVSFKSGWLLVDTLRDLLEGRLEVDELPKFRVLEKDGRYFAITGNRRLWVLKEFAKMTGNSVHIRVKTFCPRWSNSAWFTRMWTTTNDGNWVDYVIKYRLQGIDRYPSMGFALAAASLDRRLPLRQHDLKLGAAIASSTRTLDGSTFVSIERLSQAVGWGTCECKGSGPLKEYLAARPSLYVLPTLESPVVRFAEPVSRVGGRRLSVPGSTASQKELSDKVPMELCPGLRLSVLGRDNIWYQGEVLMVSPPCPESRQIKVRYLGQSEVEWVTPHRLRSEASHLVRPGSKHFAFQRADDGSTLKTISLGGLSESVPQKAEKPEHLDVEEAPCRYRGSSKQHQEQFDEKQGQLSAASDPPSVVAADAEPTAGATGTNLEQFRERAVGESMRETVKVGELGCSEQAKRAGSQGGLGTAGSEPAANTGPEIVAAAGKHSGAADALVDKMVSVISNCCAAPGSMAVSAQVQGASSPDGQDPWHVSADPWQVSTQQTLPTGALAGGTAASGGTGNTRGKQDPRQSSERVGGNVTVVKHSSVGCAVITFDNCHVCNAILRMGSEVSISGVTVQIRPHNDLVTGLPIPTDIFTTWDDQVEKVSPLSQHDLMKHFDRKCDEVVQALFTSQVPSLPGNGGPQAHPQYYPALPCQRPPQEFPPRPTLPSTMSSLSAGPTRSDPWAAFTGLTGASTAPAHTEFVATSANANAAPGSGEPVGTSVHPGSTWHTRSRPQPYSLEVAPAQSTESPSQRSSLRPASAWGLGSEYIARAPSPTQASGAVDLVVDPRSTWRSRQIYNAPFVLSTKPRATIQQHHCKAQPDAEDQTVAVQTRGSKATFPGGVSDAGMEEDPPLREPVEAMQELEKPVSAELQYFRAWSGLVPPVNAPAPPVMLAHGPPPSELQKAISLSDLVNSSPAQLTESPSERSSARSVSTWLGIEHTPRTPSPTQDSGAVAIVADVEPANEEGELELAGHLGIAGGEVGRQGQASPAQEASRPSSCGAWSRDLPPLLQCLPVFCRKRFASLAVTHQGNPWTLTFDDGLCPRAMIGESWTPLSENTVTASDLEEMLQKMDVAAGASCGCIKGTLHRVAVLRAPNNEVNGITVKAGRALIGVAEAVGDVRDFLLGSLSVIILGLRGEGKTLLMRDAARFLSTKAGRHVLVLDSDGEIGGVGHGAHKAVGFARRATLPRRSPDMVACVNEIAFALDDHRPDTLILDDPWRTLGACAGEVLQLVSERQVRLISSFCGTLHDFITAASATPLQPVFSAAFVPSGRENQWKVVRDLRSQLLRAGTSN